MENYIKWENCRKSPSETCYINVRVEANFSQFLEGDYLDNFVIDWKGNVAASILKYLPDGSLNGAFTRLSSTNQEEVCYRDLLSMPGFVVNVALPKLEK